MIRSVLPLLTKPIRPGRASPPPPNVLEFNQGPGHTESGARLVRAKKKRRKNETGGND